MAGIVSFLLDGLSAVAAGLLGRQPGQGGGFIQLRSQQEIEAAYRMSWLCAKIHDLPPYDMTRAWRTWQADKGQITLIEAEERRLGLRQKVRRALWLARLHGGGALILGLPGNPNEEAAADSLGKGGLAYVHVVSRHQLTIRELERDVTSPYFGQPRFYEMTTPARSGVPIHPSRVIPFLGRPIPEGAIGVTADDFWGDPLLMSLASGLDNSDRAQAAIADMLDEAKVDIISIPNLMEMLGQPDYEQRLLKRLTLAASIKKSSGTLLISAPAGEGDQGEKWETKQLSFDGLPDLARMFLQVASGAADIPATRLLGQSPDGMNATGESDLRNYYDALAGRQSADLQPSLDPLDEMLLRSALGSRPEEIFYEWESLWQLTPEAKAEVAKKTAEAIKIIADTGLVPTRALEESVQNRLIEDGMFPGLEDALDELPEGERFPSENPDNDLEADPTLAVTPADPRAAQPRRRAANDARLNDASPRTLYVRRDVLNGTAIIAHFKEQGLEGLRQPGDLHVTLASSKQPLDWMKVAAEWSREPNGNLTVAAGGPRIVEPLGPNRVTVQLFNSPDLSWRHQDIKRAGASWDYEEFQPHITVAEAQADGFDLDQVEPWRGVIELGPEIFEEVNPEWNAGGSDGS